MTKISAFFRQLKKRLLHHFHMSPLTTNELLMVKIWRQNILYLEQKISMNPNNNNNNNNAVMCVCVCVFSISSSVTTSKRNWLRSSIMLQWLYVWYLPVYAFNERRAIIFLPCFMMIEWKKGISFKSWWKNCSHLMLEKPQSVWARKVLISRLNLRVAFHYSYI